MSFDSCLISLDLGQRLPVAQLRELSKKYTGVGVSPETALRIVLNDQLELARAQETKITQAVRSAWAKAGGVMPAAVDSAPTARPEAVQPGQLADLNEMFTELLAEEAAAKPASDDLNSMFTELLAEVSGVDPRPTVESIVNPKKPRRVRAKNAFATLEQEAARAPHLYAIYKARYLTGKGDAEATKKVRREIAAAEKELAFYPPGILTPAAMYNVRPGELSTEAGALAAVKYIISSLETSARSALDELERGDWSNDNEAWAEFTKRHKYGPHMTREYFDMLGAGVDVDARRATLAKKAEPTPAGDEWGKPDTYRAGIKAVLADDADRAIGMPIKKLKVADVYGALTKNPAVTVQVAERIATLRPDLKSEVDAVMRDELAYVQRDGKWVPGGKTKLERIEEKEAAAKAGKVPREMTHLGRAVDGKPLKPGDVFKTSSGRTTTPFPKQAQQKYLSQWVIDNAVAEAESRGDKFNAPAFNNIKPMRNGMLTQADSDSMHEYLFGEQPAVVPSILKPLAPKRAEQTPAEKHIAKFAKKPGDLQNGQVRKILLDAGPMAADVAAILGEEGHLVTAVGKAMEEFGYKFVRFDGLRPIFERPAAKAETSAAETERGAGAAAVSAVKNAAGATVDVLDALGELFGGNKLNSGLTFNDETYAKAKPLFKSALAKYGQAGQDVREVMRTILKAVLEKFGYETTANMQPYIVRYVEEYRTGKLNEGENNAVDGTAGSATGDQEYGADGDTAAERDLFHVGTAADGEARPAGAEPDKAGTEQQDRAGVSGRDAAVDRAEGDQRVRAPESRPDGRAAEPRDTEGGGRAGREGARPDGGANGDAGNAVDPRTEQGRKLEQQRQAAGIRVKLGDRTNIDETLPYLLEGQRDDVAFAEKRFAAAAEGKMPGVLFTNGTGTGKTFTGLGILARQIRAGNTEGMIVVPNNQIAQDWITSAERLGITIRLLGSTSENGEKGATITTFANFGNNPTLADREYDWLLADESHYLMASKDGDNTDALATFRALTRHPKGFATYSRMKNRDLYQLLAETENKESARAKHLFAQIREREETQLEQYRAVASVPAKRPKAIFLSATPFAYVKSVDYAEGYLFEYPSDGKIGNSNQDGRAHFFVRHFGYRIRYHKLTEPDGNVDVGLMARQFNSWLKAEGALSGRMLEVEADYGRRFVQVESALGAKIDEGMEFMREHPEYKHLYQPFMKEFTYLRRRYLLEAIKAKEALPIIQQHLDMGRKVIVIHDYKKGGASNPFHMTGINGKTVAYDENMQGKEIDLAELAEKFKAERPDLVRLKFPATSALQTLLGTFPTALVHNGDVPAKQLEANKKIFNTDNNGRNVIILQSDKGREGISLHDTTGVHQRVEVVVGMAAKPTALIQLEGRAYRTGQVSDAAFDYIVTGTMWERWTFAQTIAERADIAEALAMGEQARALKDAIVEAFENAGPHAITENDGKGGKERDRQAAKLLTDWDRARTFYYGQLKRNSSTKALEGKDYFATPEPLGLKMVEWADIRPGEDVLEPSAGHGAIARWFPILSNKTVNEKETELITRARLAVDGSARFLQGPFEDINIVNKFDAIVMNPPFGLGGSLAIPHLAKAYQHLRDGGRIVALLPRGPAADGKLEKFLYGDKAPKDLYMVADIELPSVTFNRAGTSVPTHIVILDKISDPSKAPHQVARDYTSAEDIEEFFERIQHSSVPGRVKTDQPIEIALEEQKKAPKKQPREAAADAKGAERYYAQFEFKHTKTGEQLYGAAMLNRTSMDTYKEAASIAKTHGGWYNKFVGGGALRGFLFRSSEERAAFMAEAGELAEVSEGMRGDEGIELRDISDQRTIEVDGVRRPIRYSNGELVAPDFMAQLAFWREYKGEVDERGRPIAPELSDIDRDGKPWARAAQLEWERGTEHMIQAELPDGTSLLIYDANDGEGAELSRVDADGNDYPGATQHADIEAAKAAAQLQYEQILAAGPLVLDVSELMTDSALRAGDEPKRVATTAKLKKYRRQLEEGKITADEMAERVADLIDELDERNAAKAAPKERERGVEWVQERLMRARRLGEIDREAADFALWALEQAPHLAEDLGISLRAAGERGTAGVYNPISRVITLFKGADNTGTAVHEILHHTERMMPGDVQGKIVKAWADAWARAYAKADEKTRPLLLDMLEMAHSREATKRVLEGFSDGALDYDKHYQLVNPSEYWAVNATRIMQNRFGANSWPVKAKRWMLELMEKAKGLLGLQSDAPILRGLRAVLEGTGERLSPLMLVERGARPYLGDLADRARTQTSAAAFKRWFGDSTVVDANGEPLVVYHGTNKSFDTFKDGLVHWFAEKTSMADGFTPGWRSRFGSRPGNGANVLPVYLNIRNAVDLRGKVPEGERRISLGELIQRMQLPESDAILAQLAGKTDLTEVRAMHAHLDNKPLIEALKAAGYDGYRWDDSYKYKGFEKVNGKLQMVEDSSDSWAAFDPAQIKSATGNNGEFDQHDGNILRNINRRQLPTPAWSAPADTRLDRLRHALQDKHIDMKRTVQAVRDAIGELGDKWNPYLQEELYHGRSATGFKAFLENELRPLLTDMQARGVTMEQLEEFLHMRHAEEANARLADINDGNPDGLAGVDTQDALDYLANLSPAQLAKYSALANRVDAIIKGTQRVLLDYGLEKQSTIDAWNATYQHYVPLHREDMDAGQLGNGTGAGYSVRGSASQARTGSKRAVVDILANIAMAREKAIVRGEKNRVSMALYGMALQAPNPGFWKPVNPQKNPAALEAELLAMGLSPAEAAGVIAEPKKRRINKQTGMVENYVSLAVRSAPHVVAVRVNGEDRFLFFNERNRRAMRMATSIKNVGEDVLDGFMGAVAWATRQLAAMNTQYNPIFGAVNLVRDLGEGAINLSATPIAGKQPQVLAEAGLLLAKVIKARGRMSNLSGADAALWAEFQEEGGITGYRSLFARSEDRMKELQTELSRLTANPARKAGRAVLDWLSDYNEALENVTRLSAYKVAKAEGLSNQQAASLAKNLTVNFNRKGAKTRILGALYAFFNAAVQGTTRMLETLTGPAGKAIIAGGIILGVLQSTVLNVAGFKDEDIPEFVRAKNLVIPASLVDGEKDYLTIPMPLGFSFLPSIGRLGTDFALDGMKHPGRYGSRLLTVMLDMANPLDSSTVSQMISPTVTDPVIALAENKDFTGRDIAREDMNKLKPTPGHTRAKETASAVGTGLSWFFNAATGGTDYSPGAFSPTPDQIDYFIGQLTGGVGRELMKAQQTAGALVTGEEVSWNKVPLAGRFYSDANDKSAVATKFYENVKQLAVHDAEVEGRRRDKLDVKQYRAEHPEAKLADKSEAVLRDIAGLRERRRHWLEQGDKVRVKEFELKIRSRMQKFNDEVEAARSTAP